MSTTDHRMYHFDTTISPTTTSATSSQEVRANDPPKLATSIFDLPNRSKGPQYDTTVSPSRYLPGTSDLRNSRDPKLPESETS